jgi:hypothetical protein
MRAFITVTAIGAGLISGAYCAIAQTAVPIGHRQPTAAVVPQDDSFPGTATQPEGRSVTVVSKKSRAKRDHRNPLNPDVGFPDICSNCNN